MKSFIVVTASVLGIWLSIIIIVMIIFSAYDFTAEPPQETYNESKLEFRDFPEHWRLARIKNPSDNDKRNVAGSYWFL